MYGERSWTSKTRDYKWNPPYARRKGAFGVINLEKWGKTLLGGTILDTSAPLSPVVSLLLGGTRLGPPVGCGRLPAGWMDRRYSPMETSFMFSFSRNSRATDTFSNFICPILGLVWYLRDIFFWLRTSSRAMSLKPSARSTCRSTIPLLTHFRCSLIHRVKVFCWIFFHGASSASSFSVAGIASLVLFVCSDFV